MSIKVSVYGQTVNDIDLLRLGTLKDCSVDAEFNHTSKDGETNKVSIWIMFLLNDI